MKINGKNTWLPGYAQRSTDEWAAIGVPPQWLQDYDAALIRKSNAKFVRWMHVAPKPAPVRAFDKFGIVNVAPAGDKEGDVKGRAWAQRVEAMRDTMIYFRNSPSVVFWEAGRKPGKVALAWKCVNGPSGVVALETLAVAAKGGILEMPQQEFPVNAHEYKRKTDAPAIQDLTDGKAGAATYKVFVNGVEVKFPKGLGAPVKPDDNTGVCCAYVPVLEAMKAAGAKLEFVHEPKRIPASKKWLRDIRPTPYQPMITVKAGGREIDACAGFTELFIDNGKDKNLTNCEIYRARNKSPVVCGELISLVGYIPGVELKTDTAKSEVRITVK